MYIHIYIYIYIYTYLFIYTHKEHGATRHRAGVSRGSVSEIIGATSLQRPCLGRNPEFPHDHIASWA